MSNHAGPHHDRRRRVLSEERTDELGPATVDAPTGQVARYPASALTEGQPRLSDLVPRRWWVMGLGFLLGLSVIAGLETLYDQMPRWAGKTTDGRVAAFDLDGEGSLAVWWSSMLLTLAAVVSLVIYALRRHRQDDYRGRYRVWPWAAVCWLVMSIDETGSLHEGFKELMFHATGQRIAGDGSLWWVIGYGVILGSLGLWLLFEVWECRAALVVFCAAAASLAVAVAAQLGWILPDAGARGVMLEEGCEMLGYQLILFALVVYAGRVIRDAEDRSPAPVKAARKKPAAAKSPAAPPDDNDAAYTAAGRAADTAVDDEESAPLFTVPRRSAAPLSATTRVDAAQAPSAPRPLSKAERKALARKSRRES